jgi:preprotein translocase subunit SecA
MSQFPNNRATQVTEFIMAEVRSRLPDMPTHEYNRVYESCYKVLGSELPDGLKEIDAPPVTVIVDPQSAMKEFGRNAPCPCRSGKKFKRCCGRPRPLTSPTHKP